MNNTDAETEKLLKIMKIWLLVGAGSIILLFLSLLLIFYGNHAFVPKIVNQILVVIQFGLIIIATIYYLKLRKLKKPVVTERSKEELLL